MHRRVLAGVLCLFPCILAAAPQTPAPPASFPSTADTASADAPTPLPDIETLLARVRARYDALESLRKTYVCTMTQVADEFSSNGSKKTHTDVYQAFYVANTEVLQLISRDGKPLSPDDAQKEQERVDKRVAKLKSQQNKPAKDQVHLSASRLLKLATFSNPRRELLYGRPTLVFDYTGDPHAPAKDLSDQIMRELAGTIWVDERDSAIVHLTGHLEENFHVAGGLLVNIKKGSWFDFTQAPVNGEIWFPSQFTAHVDGRFLLFKGFNGNARDTFSDYRKLKTSMTILPGAKVVTESTDSNAAPPSPEPGTPQPDAPPQPQE
ncbi:MAG TPA: hypothetical protein VFA99_04025 [Acidobacteriaceae bacterium]|nr:hypothetical protein [Acidobacteriaceae bacterium]